MIATGTLTTGRTVEKASSGGDPENEVTKDIPEGSVSSFVIETTQYSKPSKVCYANGHYIVTMTLKRGERIKGCLKQEGTLNIIDKDGVKTVI